MNANIRRFIISCFALGLTNISLPAFANSVALPQNAVRKEQLVTDPGRYLVPMGTWTADDGLYSKAVNGRVVKESWQISGGVKTPDQIMAPILSQITQTHDILVDCASQDCGGFDFRFAIDVLPAPSMYVDLTAYRFVSARAQDPQGGYVTFLASTRNNTGYLQIVRAGYAQGASTDITKNAPVLKTATVRKTQSDLSSPLGVAGQLNQSGRVVLTDLAFKSGSSNLGDGKIQSLEEVAAYLKENTSARIAFVGHTDATGSLEANRNVSRRRAESAMSYVINNHGIQRARLQADGVGYLAPIARNDTEEGREANRRVEAVLISIE